MFSWQEQYLTRSLRSLVRYCSCHSNIKFISSRHRVISSVYCFHVAWTFYSNLGKSLTNETDFNILIPLLQTSQGEIKVNSTAKKDFMHFLKSYASPITLTVLGAVVPSLFYLLSLLEDWNPRTQVNVALVR